MSKSNTTDFHYSIARIYLIFVAIIQWIRNIFRKSPPVIENKESLKSLKELYIERNKSIFLMTHQRDNGDESSRDWNANIEPEIKDPAILSEILKDANNNLEKKWRSRVLIDNTPRGNVIMFYDIYKCGFSYYCDNAVMPYDIMNAVAMKYVVTFFCRDFFVDSLIVPSVPLVERTVENSLEPPLNNKNKNSILQDKHAFAKFKTYNNATKKSCILKEEDKKINCFLYLGGVRNWTPIIKNTKPNPINGFQTGMIQGANNNKMSYLEYKKLQQASSQ